MTKFKGFNREEHMEIGRRLRDVRYEIRDLFFRLLKAYPKSSPLMRAMARLAGGAHGPLAHLRYELETTFFSRYPGAHLSESPYDGWSDPDSEGKLNIIPLSAFAGGVQQRKPSRLSPEEHTDVSARLHSIEHELQTIRDEVWKAYGAVSRPGKEIGRIVAGDHAEKVRLAMGCPHEQNTSKQEVSHEEP
jgi:hypothetical protein